MGPLEQPITLRGRAVGIGSRQGLARELWSREAERSEEGATRVRRGSVANLKRNGAAAREAYEGAKETGGALSWGLAGGAGGGSLAPSLREGGLLWIEACPGRVSAGACWSLVGSGAGGGGCHGEARPGNGTIPVGSILGKRYFGDSIQEPPMESKPNRGATGLWRKLHWIIRVTAPSSSRRPAFVCQPIFTPITKKIGHKSLEI